MSIESKPLWLIAALREVGQSEVPGAKHNPRILEYHEAVDTSYNTDEIPWCSSFVNWSLYMGGVLGTRSAMARSFEKWGRDCPFGKGREGAIIVLSRGPKPFGHVGFYVGHTRAGVQILGGNQGNRVSVATFPLSRIVACRWPTMARAVWPKLAQFFCIAVALSFAGCAGSKVKVGACYDKACVDVEVAR